MVATKETAEGGRVCDGGAEDCVVSTSGNDCLGNKVAEPTALAGGSLGVVALSAMPLP